MAKKKYYVVWQGLEPGIYDSWSACQKQIQGYPNAKYKSFKTEEAAKMAEEAEAQAMLGYMQATSQKSEDLHI